MTNRNPNETLARVTTREAAELAGVSERTIKRWAATGRIHVQYARTGERAVCATYSPSEIRAQVALRSRNRGSA